MKKSMGVALLLAILIPGLGNLYVKDTGAGIGLLVAFLVCLALIPFIIGIFIVWIVWLVSPFMAYSATKSYNNKIDGMGTS
jgi:TM2 domain-containing membrane protein YozV